MTGSSTKPVVIFGVGELGRLVHYFFMHDSSRRIAGFTVDAPYAREPEFLGLPVVSFDLVQRRFPPADYDLFVAIGYTQLNAARAATCAAAHAKGYALASYVSTRASVWPDLQLGVNGVVMEGSVIQPFVHIGAHVIVWNCVQISHDAGIGDNCFIASGVTILGGAMIEPDCFIGAGAIIREKVRVGKGSIIAAGAVLQRDARPGSTYLVHGTKPSAVPIVDVKSRL